ncbi:hypothetical protein [Mycobacteroides abscessus]|uniref:hypothetical protein n=1 Tax=Mycobacteroides abscessus TaxID=36809 RepID=UPI00130009C5|nr:hypothetical protein [Mycobacteroides abscessus]
MGHTVQPGLRLLPPWAGWADLPAHYRLARVRLEARSQLVQRSSAVAVVPGAVGVVTPRAPWPKLSAVTVPTADTPEVAVVAVVAGLVSAPVATAVADGVVMVLLAFCGCFGRRENAYS